MVFDVCNTCELLKVKILSAVGLEKEKYKQLLSMHEEDAAREYQREEGSFKNCAII